MPLCKCPDRSDYFCQPALLQVPKTGRNAALGYPTQGDDHQHTDSVPSAFSTNSPTAITHPPKSCLSIRSISLSQHREVPGHTAENLTQDESRDPAPMLALQHRAPASAQGRWPAVMLTEKQICCGLSASSTLRLFEHKKEAKNHLLTDHCCAAAGAVRGSPASHHGVGITRSCSLCCAAVQILNS